MATFLPEVLALVVADQIYHDDDSGKLFILGSRSMFGAPSFPFSHPRLAVYVALVDGRGEVSFEIRLIDTDEEREPVAESSATISFPSPLAEVEMIFDLLDLEFPESGEYRLQLRADGQFLRERGLMVFTH